MHHTNKGSLRVPDCDEPGSSKDTRNDNVDRLDCSLDANTTGTSLLNLFTFYLARTSDQAGVDGKCSKLLQVVGGLMLPTPIARLSVRLSSSSNFCLFAYPSSAG